MWLTAAASKANAADTADALDPVLAVDVSYWSGNISESEVACWRDNDVRHVIAGTQNFDIARQQLETAVAGGMTVDAYVVLYWDFDIANQVQSALAMINGLPVRHLWLDVEKPRGNWSSTQLMQKIQQGVDACGAMRCGIYTRKVWWQDNVLNTPAFSDLPIWYAYFIMDKASSKTGTARFTGMRVLLVAGQIPRPSNLTPTGQRPIYAASTLTITSCMSTGSVRLLLV